MTDPIDKMVEAYNAELVLWDPRFRNSDATWLVIRGSELVDETRDRTVFDRLSERAAMRAAVLALAEAETTRAMSDAWAKEENECAIHNYGGYPNADVIFSIGCRAAAKE